MASATFASLGINDLIARWTNETPKKPNPSEPILLVRPEYFEQVRTAGIAIVKALYGRGKTYGFGLNLYHTARVKRDQEVIYVNAREVRDRISSLTSVSESSKVSSLKMLILQGDSLDIVRLVCTGYYLQNIQNIVNTDEGIYLATNTEPLKAVCPNMAKYLNKESTVGLREFLRDITKASPRRLVITIDEFEQVTATAGGRPNPQYVYNIIETLLKALRPGVLDELPGKFGIVLLIQELYYPTDRMRELVSQGTYPALGRMYSVYDDGSIPVIYSIDAYLEYIRDAITNLRNLKLIDDKVASNALQAFNDTNMRRLLKEYLPNMPAYIAFNMLKQLLITALSSASITPDVIKNEFASLINDYAIYAIYGGRRDVAKGSYLANALAGALEEYYRGNAIAVRVERVGFEGAYAVTDNGVRILVARLSDVENDRSYLNEFKRLYGNVLKEHCAQRSQRREQAQRTPCELIFLYLEDVRIGFADVAIRNLLKTGVDGVPVSFAYKPRKITYDDLFVLIARYNNNIGLLTGDRRYVNSPERVQSLLNKVFG